MAPSRRAQASSGGNSNLEPFPSLSHQTLDAPSSSDLNHSYNPYGPPIQYGANVNRRPLNVRRTPSAISIVRPQNRDDRVDSSSGSTERLHSNSAPPRSGLTVPGPSAQLSRQQTRNSTLEPVQEDARKSSNTTENTAEGPPLARSGTLTKRLRRASDASRSVISNISSEGPQERAAPTHEYETEVVDLLDVLGMCPTRKRQETTLTSYRSGSIYINHPHKCPKLPFCARSW